MVTQKPSQLAINKTEQVNAFMNQLDHPFQAEVQAVRRIIMQVDKRIVEQIKWNAPSFSYKDYIATFNLRATQQVHLIFHNPAIASIKSEILKGDYADRRMVYFSNMADVKAKTAAIETIVRKLIRLMDKE